MSGAEWLWVIGAGALVVIVCVLDTVKRVQRQRYLSKLSPEDREIQLREDKVFNRGMARWWLSR